MRFGELRKHPRTASLTHPAAARRIIEQGRHGMGQRARIARRNEQSVDAVLDDFTTPRTIGRNQRAAASGRFDQDARDALPIGRRKADDVGRGQNLRHILSISPPLHDAFGMPGGEFRFAMAVRVAGVRQAQQHELRRDAGGLQSARGFDEFQHALVAQHARGQHHAWRRCPSALPGPKLVRIDTGPQHNAGLIGSNHRAGHEKVPIIRVLENGAARAAAQCQPVGLPHPTAQHSSLQPGRCREHIAAPWNGGHIRCATRQTRHHSAVENGLDGDQMNQCRLHLPVEPAERPETTQLVRGRHAAAGQREWMKSDPFRLQPPTQRGIDRRRRQMDVPARVARGARHRQPMGQKIGHRVVHIQQPPTGHDSLPLANRGF